MSGSFGAANHCNHQPTSDGLPKLFWTIYPAHRCVRGRSRWSTVSEAGWKVKSYCLGVSYTDSCREELPLHSSKREFLALKWAITEQFRDYLYYAPHFTVYTDNSPLTYAPTSELSDFKFTVKYRPGTANRDADALSRMPMEQYICECQEGVEPEWVKATVEAINAQRQGEAVWLAALSSKPKGVRRMMADKVTLQVQPITPKELY